MANITVYLPKELHEKWKRDKKRRGVVVKLLADYYGLAINESRVTVKETQP